MARRELVGQAIAAVLARVQGQQAGLHWQVVLMVVVMRRQLQVGLDCYLDQVAH